MTESQRDEISTLLQRFDELSYTEGVDSEEYEEVEKQLEAKRREYNALDIISIDED
jgi:hypothetical protein